MKGNLNFLWIAAVALPLHSQVRFDHESFREAKLRYFDRLAKSGIVTGIQKNSAMDAAVPLSQLDGSKLPVWGNTSLKTGFETIRDERSLLDPDVPRFARRKSWLYPDDGCYTRTALSAQSLEARGYLRPYKLFIFGALRIHTPNTSSGKTGWWYHVVPAVKVEGKTFVLDPAIEPNEPLLLSDWVSRMGEDSSGFTAAICGSFTYVPSDSCENASPESEKDALSDEMDYLSFERSRISDLGRDPDQELGDFPPWKKINGGLRERVFPEPTP